MTFAWDEPLKFKGTPQGAELPHLTVMSEMFCLKQEKIVPIVTNMTQSATG
jgi:hypothetical protein